MGSMRLVFIKVVAILVLQPALWAADLPPTPIPGLIPRFYSIEPATDLPIPPEVAHKKALNGEIDLSLLDPDSKTTLWNPKQNSITTPKLLATTDTVTYTGDLASRIGVYRFTVRSAQNKELVLFLSKKAHNLLLHKNILEKIGYNIPSLQWLPNLQVNFKNTIDRDLFLEEMKSKLLAGADRWIVSQNGLTITLQDLIVMSPDSNLYNLALGIMNSDIHMGRRLLRAPYIANALVDSPESLNLMPWQVGRLIMNQIKLYHSQELATSYGTSWEDAQWIGRRISALKRSDIEEIVSKAYFPEGISQLFVEKITSRRNDLVHLLKLENEFSDISFDPNINYGSAIQNGEVVQEFFQGFASRFSFGDPESPFNSSELGSFALTQLQSQGFNLALDQLNSFMATNDQKLYTNAVKSLLKKEGPLVPTSLIVYPSVHGEIILSRDIVVGTYLGTNNKVQLVDNIGVSLDAGIGFGIEGLPVPLGIQGQATLGLQRMYSHIKPVQTLKKSLKEPYKNLMVPLLVRGLAKEIDKLNSLNSGTPPTDQEKKITEVVGALKAAMGVGESFIITDSIVPQIGAKLGFSAAVGDPMALRAFAEIGAKRLVISRFHLTRTAENMFQVYQDKAKGSKILVTIGLKSYVPILKFQARWAQIGVKTEFYPLDLSAKQASVQILKALQQTIFSHNAYALKEVMTPHQIDHSFSESANTLNFFFYKQNRIGADHRLVLTHASNGAQFNLNKRYDAYTDGNDYENYTVEAINELVGSILKVDNLSLNESAVTNPGFTIGGSARNRIFTTESDGNGFSMAYQRVYNGWRASRSKFSDLMAQINQEQGVKIFDELGYKDVKAILLYNIQMQTVISREGVYRLLALREEDLRKLLIESGTKIWLERDFPPILGKWMYQIQKTQEILSYDPVAGMAYFHQFLNGLFSLVKEQAVRDLIGKDNYAFMGRIDGFREGTENGDSPIFSNMVGELPPQLHSFPSQKVIDILGIIEGELMASWVSEQAI